MRDELLMSSTVPITNVRSKWQQALADAVRDPDADDPRTLADWEPALQVLREDTSIHEVLLSGGDPLMLTDARLGALVEQLEAIPHLRRLRIHSRLPIVL